MIFNSSWIKISHCVEIRFVLEHKTTKYLRLIIVEFNFCWTHQMLRLKLCTVTDRMGQTMVVGMLVFDDWTIRYTLGGSKNGWHLQICSCDLQFCKVYAWSWNDKRKIVYGCCKFYKHFYYRSKALKSFDVYAS